jgi:hypothetical protein
MIRPRFLLAVLAVAFLVAAPTTAEAGKKTTDPNAFHVDVTISWKPADAFGELVYSGSFRATGAFTDSGPAGPGEFYALGLAGSTGYYEVGIVPSVGDPWTGTFTLYREQALGSWRVIGIGTAHGSMHVTSNGSRGHVYWDLDGVLGSD